MQRSAIVVRRPDGKLMARVMREEACSKCGACREHELLVELPRGDYAPGEVITLALPAKRLLGASYALYGGLLALLFVGMGLGYLLAPLTRLSQDLCAFLGAIALMGAGLLVLRALEPTIARSGRVDPCAGCNPERGNNNGIGTGKGPH